jgi:hypothetical protein
MSRSCTKRCPEEEPEGQESSLGDWRQAGDGILRPEVEMSYDLMLRYTPGVCEIGTLISFKQTIDQENSSTLPICYATQHLRLAVLILETCLRSANDDSVEFRHLSS